MQEKLSDYHAISFSDFSVIMSGLGDKYLVRSRILSQPLSRPLKGGIQTKMVYLTDDYALHVLRVRGASSLNSRLRKKIDGNRVLRGIDQWLSRYNLPFMHSIKQNIKILLELSRRNFGVLSNAKLHRTLRSHRLAEALGDLADPYIYFRTIVASNRVAGLFPRRVRLSHVIVKQRNDRFVLREIIMLAAEGRTGEIKCLVQQAVQMDEMLWRRGRFNTDLVFLGNLALRDERLVLRDLGALTDNYDEAARFIAHEAQDHITETAKRLGKIAPATVITHYLECARMTYTLANIDRCWLKA